MQDMFIELLQVSIGTREVLSRVPSSLEWEALFEESQRQAILGVLLSTIERLPESQRPPQIILLQWIGICQQIEIQNQITTQTCKQVCEKFEKDGFIVCILKGQSNYRYYPENILNRRSCGDIDIWVKPCHKRCKHPVKRILKYVQSNHETSGLCWLHTSHYENNGIPVEVHMRASFMNEPCKNRRFQKYFDDITKCLTIETVDGVAVPCMKVDEDVIYQMNHIYRHLIDEGVGLRQLVDYYYLLCSWNKQHSRSREETMKIVSWLGMRKFAGALMYVLREVCGMKEEYLLCPASDTDGEFLMNEIMLSGNFGQGDLRMKKLDSGGGYYGYRLKQAWRRFKRNMRFITNYPEEVVWEPVVRVEHFVWKKLKLWRF